MSQTINPNGVTSSAAIGLYGLARVIRPNGIIPGAFVGQISLLLSRTTGIRVFINGSEPWLPGSHPERGTVRWERSLSSRGNASFTILTSSGTPYLPQAGDRVQIYAGNTLEWAGVVESTEERSNCGKYPIWCDVRCGDLASILDARVVGFILSQFWGGSAATAVANLTAWFLQGSGITFEYPDYAVSHKPFDITLGEMLLNHIPFSEALNQICDAAGVKYSLDQYGVLRLVDPLVGSTPAPRSITDGQDGLMSISVARNGGGRYANRIWVKTNNAIATTWVDTFPDDWYRFWGQPTAPFIYIPTTYPISNAVGTWPSVTIDGVPQTIVDIGLISTSEYDWYVIDEGRGMFRNPFKAPIDPDAIVVVTYDNPLKGAVHAEDAAEIAACGLWEAVEEVKDLTDSDAALAIAQGLLDQATAEQIGLTIVHRGKGFEPGQTLPVDVSLPAIDDDFVIENVSASEIRNASPAAFEYAITASTGRMTRNRMVFDKWILAERIPAPPVTGGAPA
jgi:hypothetical protein